MCIHYQTHSVTQLIPNKRRQNTPRFYLLQVNYVTMTTSTRLPQTTIKVIRGTMILVILHHYVT